MFAVYGSHANLMEKRRIKLYQAGHSIMKVNQVGQAGSSFHEPMLARPDPLDATHVLCYLTQDDLLHNFPWY